MTGGSPGIAEVGKTLPLMTLIELINADRGKSLPLITLMALINTDRERIEAELRAEVYAKLG
jgi:hypothetical protein